MGQKVNPIGMRLGINRTWDSRWFANKNYAAWLEEDIVIRRYLRKRLAKAGISTIIIERQSGKIRISISTARPGMVIGRKGAEVDFLSEELAHLTDKEINLDIKEVKRPEMDARLVAEHIAEQLEMRVSFRRAMKKAIGSAMRMGAEGVKIQCAGRLGGAEMSRVENYMEGKV
ncbi:30S ribosomal protein S3, partial [bacterium]|nr:30S ribosomal protein S3 [bacterium]